MDNYTNQPQQSGNYGTENQGVMSLGDWIITLIVTAIPCVNIIMLFVWGFGNGNENRKNYCRAYLIFMAICMVIGFLLSLVMGASIMAALAEIGSY